MPNSKLEYIIEHMGSDEKSDFRAHLANSRRKRDEVLGQMWDVLQETHLENAELYAVLYPTRDYSDKQIRNLRSELFRKVTDFLAFRLFMESSEMTLFVARAMNEKHATRHFPALLDKYLRHEAGKALSLNQFEFNNRLQAEILLYQSKVEGRKNFELNALLKGTEAAFVARMIYHALAYHTAFLLYPDLDEHPPIRLWDAILAELEAGAWGDSAVVQLYYSLYKMAIFPDRIDHFYTTQNTLAAHIEQLDKVEAKRMYTLVLNHCIRRINGGQQEFLPELLKAYRMMLENGILIQADGIEPWHFKAAVTAALRLDELQWARNFMDEQAEHLPSGFRDVLLHYLRGRLAFQEEHYERAETHLHQVMNDNTDPFMALDARSYLLRVYYETENLVGMESLVSSFRLYLRRHKHLKPERLKNYQEFLRFFRRLMTLPPDHPKRARKLLLEIEKSPHQAGRDWLQEKLKRLLPQEKQA